VTALKRLQYRVDSVVREDALKNQYILGLKNALSGESAAPLDTTQLDIPPATLISD
jgi:hypothetical protein